MKTSLRHIVVLICFSQLLAACDREQAAWNDAALSNTVASFEQYLSEFPEGRFVQEAESAIHALQEPLAWETASSMHTESSYKDYLAQYPDGAHAAQASYWSDVAEKIEQVGRFGSEILSEQEGLAAIQYVPAVLNWDGISEAGIIDITEDTTLGPITILSTAVIAMEPFSSLPKLGENLVDGEEIRVAVVVHRDRFRGTNFEILGIEQISGTGD